MTAAAHRLEYLAVAALTPYARNSRIHSDDQIAMLADSIRRFGFNQPVLIDGTGTIIAGHGRVMAAKAAGLAQVPCIRLQHLTDAERRAYVIADNRIAEHARWDDALLSSELGELSLDDTFTASELGFDDAAWNSLLAHGPDLIDSGDSLAPTPRQPRYDAHDAPDEDPDGQDTTPEDDPTADDHADRGAGLHNPAEGKGIRYPVILQLDKPTWQRWKQWRGQRNDTTAITALLDLTATLDAFGLLTCEGQPVDLQAVLERLTGGEGTAND